MQKLTYTVKEASQVLGVSEPTMYRLIHIEGFPVLHVGRKKLIPIEPFEKWVNDQVNTKED